MKRRTTIVSLTLFVTLLFPSLAAAAPLSTMQIQAVLSLLRAFGLDAGTIANVETALGGSGITTSRSNCLTLNNNLYLDQTDATTNGEVTKLQQFLGGRATGYFGPATLQLVQSWQAAHSIVSSGSPDTTGYGYVGPKTRGAMSCGTDSPNNIAVTTTAAIPAAIPTTPAITTQPSHSTAPLPPPPLIQTPTSSASPTSAATAAFSISDVVASISGETVTIGWKTSVATNGKVFYFVGEGLQKYVSSPFGFSGTHSVSFIGLPLTTYSYRIEAISSAGEIRTYDGNFTTQGEPLVFVTTTSPSTGGGVQLGRIQSTLNFRTRRGDVTITEISLKAAGDVPIERFDIKPPNPASMIYKEAGGANSPTVTFSDLSIVAGVGSPGYSMNSDGSWITGALVGTSLYATSPQFGQTTRLILDGYKYRTSEGNEVVVTDDYPLSAATYMYPVKLTAMLRLSTSFLSAGTQSASVGIGPEGSSVLWRKLAFGLTKNGDFQVEKFSIHRAGDDASLAGTTIALEGDKLVVISDQPQPIGSYVIKFDVTGLLQTGYSLSLALRNSGLTYAPPTTFDSVSATPASVIWSDGSSNWLNDFGIELGGVEATTVK